MNPTRYRLLEPFTGSDGSLFYKDAIFVESSEYDSPSPELRAVCCELDGPDSNIVHFVNRKALKPI